MASELATDPSDADLLAGHVDGDPDAFATLFARHRDRLWAVALRTCGRPELAADGLQEGVVAAFRRADSFRGEAAVTTWLHRIVVNACLDRLRAERVRRAEPLPDDLDESERPHHTQADPAASDPVEQSLAGERRQQVRVALAALTPEQRAAVVLVDMEGYSVAEVAQILDCAEGTVKSRCSRARARLAVLLADLLEPGAAGAEVSAPTAGGGNLPGAPDVGSLTTRGPPADPAPVD